MLIPLPLFFSLKFDFFVTGEFVRNLDGENLLEIVGEAMEILTVLETFGDLLLDLIHPIYASMVAFLNGLFSSKNMRRKTKTSESLFSIVLLKVLKSINVALPKKESNFS